MKTQFLHTTRWLLAVMLLVLIAGSGAMAQTNDDNPDYACVNTT